MQMDAGEICRSYAVAKNKNDQIKMLADLNDCSTQEILDVLTEGGMISGVPKQPKQPKQPGKSSGVSTKKWTLEEERELIKLYENGVRSLEIAEKLGRDQKQVYDKVHYLRKKGYIFTPEQRRQSVPSEVKAEPVPAVEPVQKDEDQEVCGCPTDREGINPLGMLFDCLPPSCRALAARVDFADEYGKIWRIELKGLDGE